MPTVRHTGSLFLRDILCAAGYERVTLRGEAKPLSLVFDHVYDLNMPRFDRWLEGTPTVVIPLRDPQATARGWAKRDEMSPHFEAQWRNIISFAQYAPWYVPIDTPDRQERFDALAEHIGAPLETDWEPVNTSPNQPRDVPDVSHMYDWPVIRDFYSGGSDAVPLHRRG